MIPFIDDGEVSGVVPDAVPNAATHTSQESSCNSQDNNTTSFASPQPGSNTISSPESTPESQQRFRSLREIYETCDFALSVSDPIYYDDAAQEQVWQDAMAEEMKCIQKNNTWELVDLPEGKNAIGLKWVFRTKYHADGRVQKHKARLVAKGYAQEQGVDYDETFSPVARFETVRTFLALAAQLGWPVFQFDVKSAFLNGELKEEVYVAQPEGFVVHDEVNKVYRLQKALYGLKQAPRAWYHKIDSYFLENGFQRSENEPTLYLKKQGTVGFLVVCLYVDDMIYMGSCESIIAEFKSSMLRKFEMTDMGLLHYFLGLEVKQGVDGIFLSQRKFAEDLLKKFQLTGCTPAYTPMNPNEKLSTNDDTGAANARLYRSMVGGLNYLSHTRPDIAHSVGLVSRFMHKPTKHHLGAVKRIMHYIAGTSDYGIWYNNVKTMRLVGYCDSDWAGSLDDRKSTSGYVFTLGSGAISWSSKKQSTVALSSSEAEYAAITSAACQAIWLRRLLADFLQDQVTATEIYCDNMSAINLTKNAIFHSRTKHIDIRHHFIRELVAQGDIAMKFCTTNQQMADILTKSLAFKKQDFFMMKMGVCNFESRGYVG